MSYYYYFKKGDLRKCYEFAKKQQELYNSNKKLMLEYIERYILVTNDLLTFQKRLGKIDEFKTTLAHLRELPAKYGNLIDESYQISIIVPTYYMELSYFIESGNFEKGEKLMGDIEAYLNQIGEKVEKHRGALIYFRAALLYFILENNNRSLYWLNKILNDASPAIPREISSDSRILNLLIHFELQDFDLLEYTLKSTYRYLTKIEKLYKFETVILDFIRKSFKIKTNSELMDGFRKLKVKLVELSKDEYERKPLVNLNLIPWLESKIEKRKFAEVLKERAG